MLPISADRLHGWFFRVLLGALILVFAAWGAYGIVDVGFGAASYAAKADAGEKMRSTDANREWRRQQLRFQQLYGGEIPEAQRQLLQDGVLENLIARRLLTERAHDRAIG